MRTPYAQYDCVVRTLADDTIKVKFVGDMSGLNDELRKAKDAISRLGQDLTLSSTSASGNTTTGNSGGVTSVTMEADPELKKQITALIRRISSLTSAINKPPNNPSANTWGNDEDFKRRREYEKEQQEGIKTLSQREIALIDAREAREQAQADRDKDFDKQKSERLARDETRQAAALAAEEQRRQRRELREITDGRKRLAMEERYWAKQIELAERRDLREKEEYERRKKRDEEYESRRKEQEKKQTESETKRKEDKEKQETERNQIRRYTQAINTVNAISRVFRAFSSLARASGSNESLAYRVFGRTGVYSNYDAVRRIAGIAGARFGYDTETVLNAADANISRAGYVSDEAYQADIKSILGTAKAYGMDASTLADASGRAVALGTVQIGNQSEFANILSQSIVEAGMTGRESEQLNVLESILEVLGDTNATVSRQTALSGLGLYNLLANSNENMRGERGAELANGMIGLAQSKNMPLDILAGFGTKYTGLQGRLALSELAENDPEQYYRQVAEGWRMRFGYEKDDFLIYFLSNRLGSVSKARMIVENLDAIQSGEYSINETDEGRAHVDELLAEYDKTGLNTREEAEANAELAGENAGHGLNAIARPFQAIYNRLGGGARTALAVGGTLATALAPSIAVGIGAKGINNTISAIRAGGSGLLGSFGRITGLGGGAGALKINPSALARTGLVITGVAEAGSTILDDIEAAQEGDTRRIATRTGQGVGRIGGMIAGAKGGVLIGSFFSPIGTAIGGLIGGIGGYIGGGYVGGGVGGIGYDIAANGGSYAFTSEQYAQLLKYKAEVERRYEEEGNNSAQEYTKRVVAPWLEAQEVSKSITERYNFDVFKPDFLSDFDRGRFKTADALSEEEAKRAVREEALRERTQSSMEAIKRGNRINSVSQQRNAVEMESDYHQVVTSNTSALDSNTSALEYSVEELKNLNVAFRNFSIDHERTRMLLDSGTQSMQYNGNNVSTLGASTAQAMMRNQPSFFQNLTFYSPSVSFPAVSNPAEYGTEENTHATGKEYVPYDRYPAMLHRGEMVLRKDEADEYRSGRIPEWRNPDFSFDPFKSMGTAYEVLSAESHETVDGSFTLNINVSGGIDGMTNDNQQIIVSAILARLQQSDMMSILKNSWTRVQNR